ncbi:Fis family transcriptional regulator [Leeia sp. TBRC 13508]|uniref:Putative Fis-like DNA-binding protein n=1 Tax=Leeia speluncae TaxID=2884804 RepID=A0ABS8D736_9NEIS|nr:Fis family transcriptional regulator [Leeia speluncae]MCB6184006.1 Fis family transcriptional regulator [Leeia speluncae]
MIETSTNDPVSACVNQALKQYFADLDGETPANIYDMVLRSIEKPMLEFVLKEAGGNQSKAADWLGLNRNTLRKKMKEHGLL